MEESQVHKLIAEVKSGNTASFGPLVEAYKNMVYSISIKITSNAEEAEEVSQDAFVKAYQGLNKFRGKAKFSTWLYQIAYFTAINKVRGKKLEQSNIIEASDVIADENCLNDLEQNERKEFIDKALTHLKPEEKGVITLYYLEEMSIEEVAKITRLSISNVKVKVHRARKKLYGILDQMLKNELNSLRHEG